MDTSRLNEKYILSFSSLHTWTLSAEPEVSDWLDHFGTIMGLGKTDAEKDGHIHIVPDLNIPDTEGSENTRIIQNYYGKYLYIPEECTITVQIPQETRDNEKARSMSFKTLVITLATLMQPSGAIFLHAATLVRNNEAVLVAASSGGGKSTTAARVQPPWHAPGDECCVVIPDSEGYLVHVMPTWSVVAEDRQRRRSWDTGTSYRLRALCILKQDNHDGIDPVGPAQSIAAITGSARQAAVYQLDRSGREINQQFFSECYRVAEEMIRSIPVYLLRTTLTGRFWDILEQKLW